MGYGPPPWLFKGQALYQLSLVKVEEARKHVPPELPLVSFFGWTLGGFYLARYTDSPAGAFDELVALGGLVWDPPASCAWAARVYVNSREARDHGVRSVGLPSRLASFRAQPLASSRGGGGRATHNGGGACSWWDAPVAGSSTPSGSSSSTSSSAKAEVELRNEERRGSLLPWRRRRGNGLASPVATFQVPEAAVAWAPRIQMFLPSFSGATPDCPQLLKYSLRLMARVRVVRPLHVHLPRRSAEERESTEVMDAVLGGRPLLCLSFEGMQMDVEEPQVWAPKRLSSASLPRAAPA